MMKYSTTRYLKKTLSIQLSTIALAAGLSHSAYAEDWTISAQGSCETVLGTTVSSGGGLKASGGTAVIRCPLTREVGSNAINTVYARLKRNSTSGGNAFCNVTTTSNYGTPSSSNATFSSNTTANQSVSINLPTQYYSGYADVYCVLSVNDTLYGVRYLQDN